MGIVWAQQKVLSCNFEKDYCQPNQVLGNYVNSRLWIVESFSESKSGNSYLRADVSQIHTSQSTFYGFPYILPSYSSMCVSFKYLLNGSNTVELRLGLLQSSKELTYIWKESTNQCKLNNINKNLIEKTNLSHSYTYLRFFFII